MIVIPEEEKSQPNANIPLTPDNKVGVVGFEFHRELKVSTPVEKICFTSNYSYLKLLKGGDTSRTLRKSSFLQFYSGRMKSKQVWIFCIY